ncbi:MAG: FliM/FliN family flagellar motor switch protein [Aureliella sp.]
MNQSQLFEQHYAALEKLLQRFLETANQYLVERLGVSGGSSTGRVLRLREFRSTPEAFLAHQVSENQGQLGESIPRTEGLVGCRFVLSSEELEDCCVLDCSTLLAYQLVDHWLQAEDSSGVSQDRPLSEIEIGIFEQFTGALLSAWNDAWSEIADESFVCRLELNASPLDSIENASVATFSCVVPDTQVSSKKHLAGAYSEAAWGKGRIRIWIPDEVVQPYSARLLNRYFAGFTEACENGEASDERVVFRVQLARATMSAVDIEGIQVGDILSTERSTSDPLEIDAESVAQFCGLPGAVHGHKAVQIVTRDSD